LGKLTAGSITQPMRFAQPLMDHPPTAQLLQDLGLAAHGHPASPFPIHAQPERATTRERQIKQLDAKLVTSFKISDDQAVVRFRTGLAPFYGPKKNNARKKLTAAVHGQMHSPVYNPGSISR
jgi:hypothetical protein